MNMERTRTDGPICRVTDTYLYLIIHSICTAKTMTIIEDDLLTNVRRDICFQDGI